MAASSSLPCLIKSAAGAQTSSMVLSPGLAWPRLAMPFAAASTRSPKSVSVLASLAISRKAVPYNGPLAPPTLLSMAMAMVLKSWARSAVGGVFSKAALMAFTPRSMLLPWSESPMTRSSSVRWSFCCVIRLSKFVIHLVKISAFNISIPPANSVCRCIQIVQPLRIIQCQHRQ